MHSMMGMPHQSKVWYTPLTQAWYIDCALDFQSREASLSLAVCSMASSFIGIDTILSRLKWEFDPPRSRPIWRIVWNFGNAPTVVVSTVKMYGLNLKVMDVNPVDVNTPYIVVP